MLTYLGRGLVFVPVNALLILTIVFFVLRVLPGDPAYAILGSDATAESLEQVRTSLGLNRPIGVQYVSFLRDMLSGRFGQSFRSDQSALALIGQTVPYTVDLAVAGTLIGSCLGILAGVLAAVRRNTSGDLVVRMLSQVGQSMPAFVLGVLLVVPFGVKWTLFPVIGGGDLAVFSQRIHHLLLPAVTVGMIQTAFVMRLTRSAMLDVLGMDYIRTARAKGLTGLVVVLRHALRNALVTVITFSGLLFAELLAGAIVVEAVFARPGIGTLLVESIVARDYPVVQGLLALIGGSLILVNLLTDWLCGAVDPRIRFE
ncbi:MAG: ABC transporter permease [Candidatus Rokubacteria bacterium]|nr:ABC transporter permease [Candidatus Rokubacteria bacterium]